MTMTRVRTGVLALLLAACSGDGGTGPGGGSGPPPVVGGGGGDEVRSGIIEVQITGTTFSPSTLTITPGSTVVWINAGSDFHTVTPQNPGQAGVWSRAETSTRGEVLRHTFSTPAQVYRYRCEPHSASFTSGMTGLITVQ